ncbi:hypothetical protein NELLIE_35 [Arthrobacter phage Nellie]|uniref:Uncharacterized protein n=3 Tax=Jasminevirus adat TaxID=2560299 RepID=A0A249XN83_9CAUD|nr:hypothetical protein FDI47_gp35 [Arthrobacter phage Adat]ASZ72607.1 hypothetical protein ADAT_35 [Arthrobacter phage Adat]ASZ73189.1 hypothetical protein GURGLEFERB_35 [Arthrobacter phage GurgleFerb]ASZ73753.1 hypothetical protein NELLIE_35 [Arthrobacter phage Nellie]
MKVRELIEKLQAFDPEMNVLGDFESGREHISIGTDEVFINRRFNANAVLIRESYEDGYVSEAHFREEDLIEKEFKPVTSRQGLFAELVAKEYQQILSDSLERGTVFLVNKDNLSKDGFVEFKIHNERTDDGTVEK